MATDNGRTVELDSTCGTSLLIAYPTGVTYTNQVGGLSCFHPRIEGVLVPFENDYDSDGKFLSLDVALSAYFAKREQRCAFDEADAEFVDNLIRRSVGAWLRVDRNRISQSYEAWVWVTVLSDAGCYFHGFGPYPRSGILTWANSD